MGNDFAPISVLHIHTGSLCASKTREFVMEINRTWTTHVRHVVYLKLESLVCLFVCLESNIYLWKKDLFKMRTPKMSKKFNRCLAFPIVLNPLFSRIITDSWLIWQIKRKVFSSSSWLFGTAVSSQILKKYTYSHTCRVTFRGLKRCTLRRSESVQLSHIRWRSFSRT